jgi:hypothetical protein
MKLNLATTLTIVFALLFLSACTKSKTNQNYNCSTSLPQKLDATNIQTSMKGWELYSWPSAVQGCDDLNYAILTGTNRIKPYTEVTNDNVLLRVVGNEQLKLLLNKFPTNEYISWKGENWLISMWGSSENLKLPPATIVNGIKQHCLQIGLVLTIAE